MNNQPQGFQAINANWTITSRQQTTDNTSKKNNGLITPDTNQVSTTKQYTTDNTSDTNYAPNRNNQFWDVVTGSTSTKQYPTPNDTSNIIEAPRDLKTTSKTPPPTPRWEEMPSCIFDVDAEKQWKKGTTFRDYQNAKCDCSADDGCGAGCLNRAMSFECDDNICNIGSRRCQNRLVQIRRDGPNVGIEIFQTKDRGFGIRAIKDLDPETMVQEFTGEMITIQESRALASSQEYLDLQHSFLAFENVVIDATKKGNMVRFANHSCEENCRIVKWVVAGKPSISLFVGPNPVKEGEELTFDYSFSSFSQDLQKCLCRSFSCSGAIGSAKRLESNVQEHEFPGLARDSGREANARLDAQQHKPDDTAITGTMPTSANKLPSSFRSGHSTKKRKRSSSAGLFKQIIKRPKKCVTPWDTESILYKEDTLSNLQAHRGVYPPTRPYKCEFEGCNKAFTTSYNLQTHHRVHTGEKPFNCDFEGCKKAFANPSNLQKHQFVHTGERPLECDFKDCDKAFTTLYNLQNHHRVHTGEKPFNCDFEGCDQAFANRPNLRRHRRIHTGEKPYKCDFEGCEKAFGNSSDLPIHQRVHTREKPFKCDFEGCEKAFGSRPNLQRHRRIHTGEKPYKCDFEGCEKAFGSSSYLTIHQRIHTGERPYTCDSKDCNKTFADPSQFRRHRTIHPQKGCTNAILKAATVPSPNQEAVKT